MITVYTEGANKGPQTFQDCTAVFDDFIAGTDYVIEEQGTAAYLSGTVSLIKLRIANPEMLDDVLPLDDTMHAYDWIPDQPITAHEVPIGVQPADWALHWRDKYYVKLMWSGYTWYQSCEVPAWDPLTQYYTLDYPLQHIFWTLSGAFFGVSSWYSRYWGYDRSCLAAAVLYPAAQVSYTGDERNQFYFRQQGADGAILDQAGRYAYFYEESVDMTQPYIPTFGLQFISFQYDDHNYIGVAIIKYGSDGTVLSARVSAISDTFFRGKLPKVKHGTVSQPAGGSGSFTNVFNSVSIPALNSQSVSNLMTSQYGAGMKIRLLDNTGVDDLMKQLWSTDLWSAWMNYSFNPISCIVSMHKVPIQILPSYNAPTVNIAGYPVPVANGVAPNRLADFSCGSVDIPEYYGSRLDYNGTTISIYLPFCSEVPLDINDCMGGSISLTYRIDIATGDCLAFVVATNREGHTTVVKEVKGNCAFRIPVSGSDGAGAGLMSALSTMIGGGVQLAAGNAIDGMTGLLHGGVQALTAKRHATSSSVQGNAACFGVTTPYVTISRAVQHRPENFGYIQGDTASMGGTVGTVNQIYDVSGYASYSGVDVSGIEGATDAELAAIKAYLERGVYI